MPPKTEITPENARSASAEELTALAHEADVKVLAALLENPNFKEKHAELMLDRSDLPAEIIERVAQEGKWTASENVRLRLAQHPHTPRRIALTIVRQLYLFDLVRVSLLPSAPAEIRRAAEEAMLARVPQLPLGEKITLARRGPGRVAGAILAEGHPQALKLALANRLLTEAQVLKALAKPDVNERVVIAIAHAEKWSCQYNVRMALLRNELTPEAFLRKAIVDMQRRDLDDLLALRELPERNRALIGEEMDRQ